ncbi:MAG: glycosyltransferase family 2 protein [Candidatus Omnitrophota bacterium]
MYFSKRVAVIIPVYNEEEYIREVLLYVPDFVDKIIIVNDGSTDGTISAIANIGTYVDNRLVLINHRKNEGVGAAITSGYKESIRMDCDISCVIAGDAQMDPRELESLVKPIVFGSVDYVKGNRFAFSKIWWQATKVRFLASIILSFFTKMASGYWHITDSQCGYTAISNEMLKKIDISKIYKRYGYPNDLLIKLSSIKGRVKDLPVIPIYHCSAGLNVEFLNAAPVFLLILLKGCAQQLRERLFINSLIIK